MKNTKLIALLRPLSTRERSKFWEYVFSPFFNKNKKIQKLCEYLMNLAPDFRQEALEKAKVFRLVFGDQLFNELQLNNVISDLLQLLYDFLAYQKYRMQPALQKNLLLENLLERGAYDHVERISRKYKTIHQKSPYRNFQYYYQEYELFDHLDRYFLSREKRKFDPSLQLKNDNLDLSYLSNKLRIACDMTSRNIVHKSGYQFYLPDELLTHYNERQLDIQQYPCISIYYQALLMLQNSEVENHYYKLKTLLAEHHPLFPQEELRVIYVYAQNYCIKKINSGESRYYEELQDLYKILLEQRIIFMNGFLTQWAYKNIITVGIRLKDFNWTEQIIHQYKENLLSEERPNAVAYNLASLYYAKQDYKKALQQLHNVEFTDDSYHLGAKIIQVKSYFELEEGDALYALIEAFKKYILRNRKLGDYKKKANNNFLNLVKKIFELKTGKEFFNASKYNRKYRTLKNRLENLEPIANKDWLEMVFSKL